MITVVKIHLVHNPHYAEALAHLSWTILNSPATAQLVLHYYNTKYIDCNTMAKQLSNRTAVIKFSIY
jgi:hypothetical protein